MIKLRILFFIFITSRVGVFAQNILTEELLWGFARIGGVSVSPDGSKIIYTIGYTNMAENRTKSDLYIREVSTGKKTKIAEHTDMVGGARFRPDGKKIGYISRKNGSTQIWEMNIDGTEKKEVSSFKTPFGGFGYSPKLNYIYTIKDVDLDKKDEKLYKGLDKTTGKIYDELNFRHWDTWSDGSYQHIFYHTYSDGKISSESTDILGSEKYDAPVKPFGGEESITFSPDGSSIIYVSKKQYGTEYANGTNSDIYKYDVVTGKTTNLTMDNKGYDTEPEISPDGKKILYLSMKTPGYEADKNRMIVLDLTTGSKEDISAQYNNSVDVAKFSFDGKKVYFLSANQGVKQLFVYDLTTKKYTQLTKGDNDYNFFNIVKKGKNEVLIGGRVNFSSPTELFEVDTKTGAETQITNVNTEVQKTITYGKVEKRWVTTHDNKKMLTWVVYPPNFDKNKKYPVLLYCQGGPQSVVSNFFSLRWNFQLMAAKGYIVVAPNRRGLPSFGTEWNDAIIGDYGGAPMKDYLSAIDDVAKEPFVNKDKMGAVGASFGGYSVYWLAGNHNNRFKCFISHCGMFNMTSWYGSTEEMFFANNDQKGPYWSNPTPYENFSPHKFVKNWNTPMLVIHNEKDFRVPLTQGIEAFNASQQLKIPSRFLYFPDENHWVLKPQNSVLWQRVFFDWLDKWLKN